MLSEAFIKALVQEIATSNRLTGIDGQWVQAIGLTGSHARGTATAYSDVDVYVFVSGYSTPQYEGYQLHRFQGQLVSISITTVEAKHADLARPESAIHAVPGLRQMQVLYDVVHPQQPGMLAALVQAARDFQWSPLQAAADAFASQQLMGYAEEAHKVLGGLRNNDESTMLYSTYGLVLGLSDVLAVHYGLMIESENSAFQQVMACMGLESMWTRYFRIAAGFLDALDEWTPAQSRARSGLHLYAETARHLHAIIEPRHAEVVNTALELINTFTGQSEPRANR